MLTWCQQDTRPETRYQTGDRTCSPVTLQDTDNLAAISSSLAMNTEVEELECTENSGLRTITCTGERCSNVSILEPLPGTVTLTGTITLLQLPWLLPSSSLRPPRRSRRRPEVTSTLPINIPRSVLLSGTSSLRSSLRSVLWLDRRREERQARVCPDQLTLDLLTTLLTLAWQPLRDCPGRTPPPSPPPLPSPPDPSRPGRPTSG